MTQDFRSEFCKAIILTHSINVSSLTEPLKGERCFRFKHWVKKRKEMKLEKQIITLIVAGALTGAFSAYATDPSVTEKCNRLVNEISNQKLLGSLEQQEFQTARDAYLENRTPENKDQMYEKLKKINHVQVKTMEACKVEFSNP